MKKWDKEILFCIFFCYLTNEIYLEKENEELWVCIRQRNNTVTCNVIETLSKIFEYLQHIFKAFQGS